MKSIARTFLAICCLVAVTAVAPAQAEKVAEKPMDTKAAAAARELIKITKGEEMATQMLDQIFAMTARQHPEIPKEIWEAVMEEIKPKEMVDLIVPVYAKHFTAEELKAIIAFHQTPVGQKFLEKQGVIMQESMQIGQQWSMKLSQRILENAQARIEAKGEAAE